MKFTKMQGAGNDYVYIDCFVESVYDASALSVRLSDRHFGVGSDGLILIGSGTLCEFRMDMYNADGSSSDMCGNGIRCVAKYIYDRGMVSDKSFNIETGAGVMGVEVVGEEGGKASLVRVDMGEPILEACDIPISGFEGRVVGEDIEVLGRPFKFTSVSMGNPHCIIFLDDDIDSFPVESYGPLIENHTMFPERVNVEFVNIVSRGEVRQRTWERGSGETLACGTGACAVLVAGVLNGFLDMQIMNRLRGGNLSLEFTARGRVFLTGPAVEVFEGSIDNSSIDIGRY